VGILAVQGDYEAHAAALERLRVPHRFVRAAGDLADCDALILPGGESTTQLQFLQEDGLFAAIRQFVELGHPVFGTCAGAILVAREVKHPQQASLALLDVTVLRNGYGRQIASDVTQGASKLKAEPLEMVFIRAPVIERVGPGVEVLAECARKPVLVRQGNVLAATFHPELTADTTVHRYFLDMAADQDHSAARAAEVS
jgi:5'-phosphate synthase pdxT subunit